MRLFLSVLGIALITSCGTPPSSSEGGYVSGTGLVQIIEESERPPAPTVEGEDLAGNSVSLEDFRGKPVVLNVWGSWCPPCRAEAPVLAELSAELTDVQFLGIVIRDQRDAARAFNAKYKIAYPSIFDQGGTQLLGFADTYPAAAVPTTYVIDDDGRIAARILDEVDRTTLQGTLDDVMGDTP